MKRKGLYLLIALAMAGAGAVHAQDATSETGSSAANDGRWYIAPTLGINYNDTQRNTNSRQFYYGVGVGKFITPNLSLEGFIDHTSRRADAFGKWQNNAYGISARFFPNGFTDWRPYVMVGAAADHHHTAGSQGWSPAAQVGLGLSKAVTDSSDVRLELGYRYDMDDESRSPYEDAYGDFMAGVSVVSRFGAPPAPPAPVAPPPPPQPDCSTLDSDNDGVNDCDDKCANTASGTIVGPDGCAKPVVIDLRGVNFKFDRPRANEHDIGPALKEPTADSIAILDQAVDTLSRYPAVQVELDGYTDSVGTDAYNQKLSERRAQIVNDYLTSHGIDASRITAVKGYGESNPVDTNKTKDGRERNRRTELVVQNPEQSAQ
ncbi:MAG TPA: OmpA family protein [Rhodanobacteraceae bacterium]|nr:OmpA family protein [Rhodanobacteraceae bacterium]